MRVGPFRLERFFAKHEFSARYLLSPSDCETLSLRELLGLASADSLTLWNELRLGYTETQGHPALRAEVARLYESIGPDDILAAAPEEAIFLFMESALDPGSHAIVLAPAYQSLLEVARSAGAEVTAWKLGCGSGGWRLDFDELQRSLKSNTRLLVVNFPHNPTGYLPSREEFDSVIAFAAAHDLCLFSDEIYRGLEYDPADRLPAACDVYDKAVSLSGLSKSYGLPGLRAGWLATRQASILERCQILKDYTTICASAPGEILAMIAVRAGREIVSRNRAIVQENLAEAERFFAAHNELFCWLAPRAGPVAFPIWTGPGSVENFCQGILRERRVMIVPGSLFEFPGSHFRIGLGRRNFAEALEQVADFCRAAFAS